MSPSRLFVAFAVGALVGGAVGALLLGPSLAPPETGIERAALPLDAGAHRAPLDPAPEGGADDPTLRPAPASHEGVAAIQEQNEALRAERARLEEEVAALEARVEALEPEPRDPRAFRFGVPERAPSFDGADWPALADHMEALAKELGELPEIVARGEQPSQAKIARIVKHNTPLASFAVAFGGDTADPTPNGAFTHPAVIANLIRASLMGTDMELTAEQELALKTLGDAWSADTARLEASIPADAPALKRTVAEVDAKLRFLDAVKGVLTSQQRAVLFPPESAGRLKLDLLSPVLVYVLAQPVEAQDRAGLETNLLKTILQHAGIEEPDPAPYAWIGRQWVDDIPGAAQPIAPTSMDLTFPHVDAVQAKARAQVAAAERILAMGTLEPAQAEALRGMRTLLYPYVPAR